jgi:hypothetical protein
MAKKYNLYYIDSFFSPLIDKETREISVNLLQADGIHPNEEGIETIVKYIGPVIKNFTQSLSR